MTAPATSTPPFANGDRAWERSGFSKLAVVVLEYLELHEACEVEDERTGEQRRVPLRRLTPRGRRTSPLRPVTRRVRRGHQPTEVVAQPKPERHAWPWYLDRIRQMPCAWCRRPGPSDAHHFPTAGSGGGDEGAIPLCKARPGEEGCHRRWHRTLTLGHMNESDTREWMLKVQVRLLAKVIEERHR